MPEEKDSRPTKPVKPKEKEEPIPQQVFGQGTTGPEQYQRGGSGSEGGRAEEESHGPERDLSDRGGGTGQRENEEQQKPPVHKK